MRGPAVVVLAVVVLTVAGFIVPVVGFSSAAAAQECDGLTSAPSELDIGEAEVGETTSASYTFENTLDQEIEVSGLSIGGEDADAFSVSPSGSFTVAPGDCTTITVEFSPDRSGDFDATLSVSAEGETASTSLDGDGLEPPAPSAALSPKEASFGSVRTGSTANASFVVSNTGDAPLAVEDVSLSGPDAFTIVGAADGPVAPGESMTVDVRFAPTSTGQQSATLSVTTNDTDASTLTATMNGEGIETDLDVQPTSFNFGELPVGESAELTVTVENTGTEPVSVSGVELPGVNESAFSLVAADVGDGTLEAGETASVTVEFTPQRARSYGGTVLIQTDAEAAPTISLSLSGRGTAADIQVDPQSVNFGETVTSETVTREVRVRNTGDEPLEVSSTSISGADPSAFEVIDGTAPFTVAPDEAHSLTVQFAPESAGEFAASLVVTSNDPNEPSTTVYLSNTQTSVKQDTTEEEDGTTSSQVEVNDAKEDDTITLVFGGSEEENQAAALGAAADLQVQDRSVSLTVMNLSIKEGGDFGVGVTSAPEELGTTPAFYLNPDNGTEPVGYLNVSHTIVEGNIEQVEFTHRVSKQRLAELDADVEDYALYRFVDGEWVELETTVVEEGDSYYVVEATSPGLSDFTSGVKQPKFRLVDGNVTVTKINTGDDVGVNVEIRNDGGADGTYTAKLLFNDEVVAQKDTTIAAENKRIVTFRQEITETGTYTVVVNNVTINNVDVSAEELDQTPATDTDTATGGSDETPAGDTDTPESTAATTPGFGILVALLALLAGALLTRQD